MVIQMDLCIVKTEGCVNFDDRVKTDHQQERNCLPSRVEEFSFKILSSLVMGLYLVVHCCVFYFYACPHP